MLVINKFHKYDIRLAIILSLSDTWNKFFKAKDDAEEEKADDDDNDEDWARILNYNDTTVNCRRL